MTHETTDRIACDRLIVTAASQAYGPSLLGLLGSLNLNWPNHPPVRVYDIGLDDEILDVLGENHIKVVKVPSFCPHWRKHFTWKIWCLNDAPARDILWMDAGLVVLKPLDEIFDALSHHGYFLVPNYHLLDWEASEAACEGCGVPPEFRIGRLTLAGGIMGFRKRGKVLDILNEALSVALVERYIAATEPTHRHDQAIISLLMYKNWDYVIISDGIIHLGWRSPKQVPAQKVWAHRRGMLPEDMAFFASHISTPGAPYIPKDPTEAKPPVHLLARFYRLGRYLLRGLLGQREGHKEVIYDGVRD